MAALLAPIIRDPGQMSFADSERTISDFGERARQGALTMEKLTGGGCGSSMSIPILNPPQRAILGRGQPSRSGVALLSRWQTAKRRIQTAAGPHPVKCGP